MKSKMLLLSLSLLMITPVTAIPILASPTTLQDTYNTIPITYANGLNKKDVPQYIIEDILKTNPAAKNITIYEVGTYTESLNNPVPYLPGYTEYKNMVTKLTPTNSKVEAKDVFQFSVAKGQEVVLTRDYTAELSGSYSGDILDSSKLNVSTKIVGKYTKSTKYLGPPETSNYNSREFRTKFFEERGNYVQTADAYENWGQGVIVELGKVTKTGTYKKPVSYANYSVDSYQYAK